MTRYRKLNTWERLIGSPALARIYEVLLYETKPIPQFELAKKAKTNKMVTLRILKTLTEDPELSNVFISRKYFSTRLYSLNTSHPVYKGLKDLYESLMKK